MHRRRRPAAWNERVSGIVSGFAVNQLVIQIVARRAVLRLQVRLHHDLVDSNPRLLVRGGRECGEQKECGDNSKRGWTSGNRRRAVRRLPPDGDNIVTLTRLRSPNT